MLALERYNLERRHCCSWLNAILTGDARHGNGGQRVTRHMTGKLH